MEKLQEIGNYKICSVVTIIKNGKILIGLRHYTKDKNPLRESWNPKQIISVWTMPGGRCEEGEKVEEALRRETAEETGITDLNITDFLGEVPGANDGDILYVFVGTSNQKPQLLEPEKFSEWKWQDINDMPENFINPKSFDLVKNFIEKISRSTCE